MQKYLTTVARILLAQIFLVQVVALVISFMNNPSGYQEYQAGLGSLGLPGIFAPLIILINLIGGLGLLLGYKTKVVALIMAIYVVALIFLLNGTFITISGYRRRLIAAKCKPKHCMQSG